MQKVIQGQFESNLREFAGSWPHWTLQWTPARARGPFGDPAVRAPGGRNTEGSAARALAIKTASELRSGAACLLGCGCGLLASACFGAACVIKPGAIWHLPYWRLSGERG